MCFIRINQLGTISFSDEVQMLISAVNFEQFYDLDVNCIREN